MDNGKDIAEEVWRMLPTDCKEIMKDLEASFKASIAADVDKLVIDVVDIVIGRYQFLR